MTDAQLFWAGVGAATTGAALAAAALFWPHRQWLARQRQRTRRMGYLRMTHNERRP